MIRITGQKQRDWKIGKGDTRWRCPDLTGFSHSAVHENKWPPRMQEETPWAFSCFPYTLFQNKLVKNSISEMSRN